MSKAKHLHAILRGQHHLLPTASAAASSASSTTTTAASLRLLPSRLVAGPSLDSGPRSIYTQATTAHSSLDHNHQTSCHHQHHHNHSASSRASHRGHPCPIPACLMHTSTRNSSLLPSSSVSAAAAAIAPSAPSSSSSSNASADSIHYPPSAAGNQAEGGQAFSEQTTAAQWASELPWIDPLTQSSYDPVKLPTTAGNNNNNSTSSNQGGLTPASFFDQPFQNTRHNYVFAHGASGFAKNPNKVSTLTPEEERAYFSVQVGEDSYFRRHDALGVADGVGANPALYSRKLMHYAFVELEKYDNIEEDAFYDYFNVNPVQILEKSYEQSARDAKKEGLIGSSTACLAILRDDELRIANLGDCGVSIIRRNEFIFRTEEQQHSFNYPYQLGTGSTDSPTDAQVFTVKVESGDIVVMGTDGIFDNLFDEDILEEVVRCVEGIDPNQNQNPFGTGNPTPSPALLSGKGVSGLWSKLASTSSSTIAAISGNKVTTATDAAESTAKRAGENEELEALEEVAKEELTSELSPIAAAAIIAAESSALPLSAALYPQNSTSGSSSSLHSNPIAKAAYLEKQKYVRKIPEPSVISDALAKRARNVAEDTRHHGSPFQSRAMQEGLYYQGGKQDDMSVLVAIIKVAEDSPDRR
ncbi:hypothetical protein EC957_004267 [Mortierella hygrophila]|uniref:Protein phosphatase n=1 Tax=Mortierella hygrophila TaxID=979708 RepID=A0A9P6FG33_9FUNG|nr:hypothetical protein EC957_004267 [Mortierella hygrophila]